MFQGDIVVELEAQEKKAQTWFRNQHLNIFFCPPFKTSSVTCDPEIIISARESGIPETLALEKSYQKAPLVTQFWHYLG